MKTKVVLTKTDFLNLDNIVLISWYGVAFILWSLSIDHFLYHTTKHWVDILVIVVMTLFLFRWAKSIDKQLIGKKLLEITPYRSFNYVVIGFLTLSPALASLIFKGYIDSLPTFILGILGSFQIICGYSRYYIFDTGVSANGFVVLWSNIKHINGMKIPRKDGN